MNTFLLFSFAPQSIVLNVLLLIVGVAIVLWGADRLTDGSVNIASKLGISQMVIGLTIVAMGTSMPEFCVSLVSSIKGTADLAVGNIVGSNIFNSLLIVGVAAMVSPILILHSTVKRDIPFSLFASALLILLCFDGDISRIDALILFISFLLFLYVTLKTAKNNTDTDEGENKKKTPTWKSVAFIVLGLVCLILGSNIFVDNATGIAKIMGVSDAVIGLTIVAGGTSLPELATSIVAARKGNSGIAIGNVLGSNVFNILFILGAAGIVCPMTIQGITMVDLTMMLVAVVLLWLFSFTKYNIARWEGAILVAVYLFYMVYLIANA